MGRGQAKAPASTFTPYRGPRDVLTGEPLITGSIRLDLSRRNAQGKPDQRATPKAMHTHQMATPDHYIDGMLGDLEWTAGFDAYMARIKPREFIRALYLWYKWHDEPWLVARMYEEYRNTRAVDVAMALYRDRWQWDQIHEEWHCTLPWIEGHYQRMTALVRSKYLLDERASIAFFAQK